MLWCQHELIIFNGHVQVYQVTKQLAQFTTVEVALSVGGLDLKMQEAMLRYQLAYLLRYQIWKLTNQV